MKLIRFKCNREDCKRDFYCDWEDAEEAEPGYPLCPFCDEGSPLNIGEIQFDDISIMEQALIDGVVIKFRDNMQGLEEILYKLENIKPVVEEDNE
jgi:hypothetical protein